jgi:tetratricopeptide (TPR) repeat protein
MKRKEKRQLKQDEFVSGLQKFINFVQSRKRELIIGAAAIAFLAVIFAGLKVLQARNAREQSKLVSRIFELRSELDKKPENQKKLEDLAGQGKYARAAYLVLAGYWVEKGDLDKAESFAAKVKGNRKDIIYYQAQDLLGKVYSLQKNYDKAIEIYKGIESQSPKGYALDAVLFEEAEALEKKGQKAEALALYKKIQEGYPQTYYGYEASQKAAKLEGEK